MGSDNNIVPLVFPEQAELGNAAEREKVIGEIKYQMCLGALNCLLELKKLTPEEYARAEKRLALRYRPDTVHLRK